VYLYSFCIISGLSSLQRWAKNNLLVITNNSDTIENNREDMVSRSFKLSNINIIDYDGHSNKKDYGNNTDTANKNEMAVDIVEYLASWVAKKF